MRGSIVRPRAGKTRRMLAEQKRFRKLVLETLEDRSLLATLVAAYGFNEGTGTTVADASGNGNTGTATSTTWTTAGRFGNALSFNGNGALVNVPNSASLSPTAGVTLEAWVNPSVVSNQWRDVIYKGDDVLFLEATSDRNSVPGAGVKVGTANVEAFGTSALAANTWTHLALTYDGAAIRLYVNGTQVSSTARSGALATSTNPLQIGGDSLYGQWFTGLIDEVRVYSGALTAAEIATDMNTPIGGTPPPPPPASVTVTGPTAGATVSHVAVVSAAAPAGTTSVEFFANGASLGSDSTSPYSINWNTTLLVNGSHSLTARARDAAGNFTTSAAVTVNTQNPAFANDVIVPGISYNTTVAFLPDGRMLIGELQNRIRVVQPGASVPDATPFLQLDTGSISGEQGLIDIAIDPNFSQNGYYYIFYTRSTAGQPTRDRLSRFTASGNGTVAGSEVVLWQDDVDAGLYHHGGAIAFGNDGKIYFTTGDHFDPPFSQRLDSLHGKVLRINFDGSIPTDNPFYDGAGPNKDAIWAYGLRNPYRMTIDSVTGRMYIGDVGGNDNSVSIEEVNVVTRGANYGWPLEEGNGPVAGTTKPIYSYPHNFRDASITGGFVYRGTQFPSEYQGSYFFGDYAQNWIKRLTFDASGNVTNVLNFLPADGATDTGVIGDPVDLVQGPDGSLYVVDIGVYDSAAIRRIRYNASNQVPVAQGIGLPTTGAAPLTVAFSSSGSYDPEGVPLTYSWNFGDGMTSTAANPSHTYTAAGQYTARLTVSDGVNSTTSGDIVVRVGSRPVPTISLSSSAPFRAGDVILYSGTASDAEDGILGASAFSWSILFHHEGHIHPAGGPFAGTTSGSLTIPATGHDFTGNTSYEIVLTVTDSTGLTGATSATVVPQKANLTFTTVPAGLAVSVDGVVRQTPLVLDELIGFQHTIDAPPQIFGGVSYAFANWSDGGAQSHNIVTPATAQTYVATFTTTAVPVGLVAAFGFNEGTGATVADASGNGNTGTATNTTWTTAGKFGNALSFGGAGSLVNVPDSPSLNPTAALTIEAWVNPTVVSGQWRDVIYKGDDIYFLEATSDRNSAPAGGVKVAGSNLEATAPTALAANTWSHLALTYDGAAIRLFVNGTQVSSTARSGVIATSANPLQIGGNSLYGQWFTGLIDEVRVYNRALSALEIQTDMNTPVGGGATDTELPTAPGNLTATATSTTQINLAWQAASDNVGVTSYRVERQDPGGGSFVEIASLGAVTSFSNTSLTQNSAYSYRVRAVDAAGNLGPYSNVASATTLPAGDTQPPTVAISSPAGGTISHVVAVAATANDNVGVTRVEFFADGASLGSDTTAPYSVNWNSTTLANGIHVLTATAYDAAGNQANSAPVSVTTLNPAFANEVVVPGIAAATTMAFLPDGRMLVGELFNVIWVVQPGASQKDATPFWQVDYSQGIGGQGVMDIAIDPNFAQNGYYYVFYTKNFPNQQNIDRLSRFTASGNTTNLSSEVVLWQDDVVANAEHHGGAIGFGPDGKIYFTVGDHFDYPAAQRLDNYHGKILRINFDGTTPTDNPFYDGPGPNKDQIWAYGLRNPYRLTFDSVTGRMFFGDVGGNVAATAVEELNLGVRGANYGWPLEEGNGGTPGMTQPIFSYPHSGRDAAITGGFVYRGSQFPSEYYGSYFFGDFAQNWMKRATFDANGNLANVLNFLPADGALDTTVVGDPVKFVPGPDGALYYVDFGYDHIGTPNSSAIRRIRYAASNQPPVAAGSALPTSGAAPLTVAFSSAGSFDPEGAPITYLWDFGDGTTSPAANPSHTYQTSGQYTARLTVSDGVNSTLSSNIVVRVGTAPVPTVVTPANGSTFRAGDVIAYSGSATDAEDGALGASAFSWSILFHHDTHIHPAGGPFTNTTAGSLSIPTTGHDYQGNTQYEIILTVTDSTGLTSSTSVTVFPEKVNLPFDTVPSGLNVTIDGQVRQTPFVLDDLVGFQHTIAAPAQSSGGTSYAFASWSDGGAQTHTIVTPATGQSYIATFQAVQPTGLVAAYGFNEGTGATVADASGSGNTGTATNTTWTTAGKFGNALSFNGTSSLVDVPSSASLSPTAALTLAAWVNPSIVSSQWRDVIYKGDDIYFLEATSDRNSAPAGGVKVAGSNLEATAPTALAANTWSHLALTYDGAAVRLFVNGTQVSSTARSGAINTSANPLQIGGNSLYGQWFTGLMDEVRVYNRALSALEIQTDMNTPIGVSTPDTQPPSAPGTLTATAVSTTQINLSWLPATDNVAVAGYRVERQDPGGSSFAQIASLGNVTTYSDSSLTQNSTYVYRVRAADATPNLGPYSGTATATTFPASDGQPPTVSISAPAALATVSHVAAVAATANDNVGVTRVDFFVDGVSIGSDTTAPFAVNWNSTTIANGAHTLTAVARDAAGNQTTSAPVSITTLNPAFANEVVVPGITSATTIAFLPDGRMLVGELTNVIWVVQPGASQKDPTPFLQLDYSQAFGEQGLMDIAIDPNFAQNGYYYVFYTKSFPGRNNRDTFSRFTASGNTTLAGSEVVLWQDDVNANAEHHGGAIAFGNDGKIYFTVGDHFDYPSAQRLDSFHGKVLRINFDGSSPTDNPFYDGAGPNKDQIWAYGLRNPYRMSIDSVTGRMYIGDVGGNVNATSIEELNLGVRGANYGWPQEEGNGTAVGTTKPIYTYPHSGRDAAITGGIIYRGSQFPSEYYGSYIFGDFVQNWMRRITFDANGNVANVLNFWPADGAADTTAVGDPVKFLQGPDGSLYYVDIGFTDQGVPNEAAIRRIRYAVANQPPVALGSGLPVSGAPPLTVAFSSAGSYDPEGVPLTYSWNFGDGNTSTAANPSHAYTTSGQYVARLTVSDGVNSTLSGDIVVRVGAPPVPTILSPTNGAQFRAGDVITYAGSATDPDVVGNLPASAFSWNILFRHETHTHPAGGPFTGTTSGTLTIPATGHDFQGNTSYEIVLTVTDATGLTGSTSVNIVPEKVSLSFNTVPSGLTINVDGLPKQTPFVLDEVIGFQHTITAPAQTLGGVSYAFVNWSDGGAQSHNITTPVGGASYVATFQAAQSQGLVAAYGFNEGAGTAIADASGTGNNGTAASTTWSTAGKFGNALSFNGTSSLVTIPDANSLDLTTGMTLQAWVRPTVVTNVWRDVIYKGNDVYFLEATSDRAGRPGGGVTAGGVEALAFSSAALAVNTWAHLALTYDGAAVRLYVNGTQAGSRNRTGSIATSTYPLQIGGNSLFGQWFTGLIDEVRVYNRALSAAEITTDMNTPVGTPLVLQGQAAVQPGAIQAGTSLLTTAQMSPVLLAAQARWDAVLVDPADRTRIQAARVLIVDLPGNRLAMSSAAVIYVDRDAAGRGWFIDQSPFDDAEFLNGLGQGDAQNRVDLLTVLAHELGHLLDQDHNEADLTDVMAPSLPVGVRRLPREPL